MISSMIDPRFPLRGWYREKEASPVVCLHGFYYLAPIKLHHLLDQRIHMFFGMDSYGTKQRELIGRKITG
jgi:hypothetical protein